MTECESLLKATVDEIEKLMKSKTVVGEPVTSEGMTVIPLLSVSMGFGAGAGTDKDESKGSGGGAGGGFKMKPVAVIVIEKDQVRVEPVSRGKEKYPLIESVLEKLPQILKKEQKEGEEKEEKEQKEEEKKDREIKVD